MAKPIKACQHEEWAYTERHLKRRIEDLENALENASICQHSGPGLCVACRRLADLLLRKTISITRRRRMTQRSPVTVTTSASERQP